ncbi:MAG TPA: acyl-CoA dehydrogenase [Rhizomicrobium sp.]|nr:acyl-CoA dehydrogenase [Rhizomicrobium sp.]
MTYSPPLRDLAFSLEHVAGASALKPLFSGYDADTEAAVLDAAGRLARDVLAPINRIGDEQGARCENGRVFAAPGFADAYRQFADGGWNALSADKEFGGQGLPKALEIATYEMFNAANMAFGLCPILTQGAIEALAAHGNPAQQALYLPKLISGEWTGTMNLTEPQSGSDLASLKTRAERNADGSYAITGQKIFITWGDHDCAENIVHLVLARLPDAPPGTKGVSLFVAPKRLVNADGSLGAANALKPGSIEHKLGIHGSPTCVMLYEGARAELVGEENRGLAHMFTMMNAARLQVGTQGVAVAERAYQQALAFSLERKQGRSAWTGEYPARLYDLPDIRRTLMLMKAHIEAGRGLCLSTAVAADLAKHAPDEKARAAAKLREELLTPIAKGWSTDMGVEVASLGVQVHGGMGFIEETGAAQHYRDARIAPIYEGTNGIQAIDLAGRKLSLEGGEAVRVLLADMAATVKDIRGSGDAVLQMTASRLEAACATVRETTAWLRERSGQPDMLAGATAYLKLMGDTAGGWMLAKGALAASRLGADTDLYNRTKIALAHIYAEAVLARVPGLAAAVEMGAEELVVTSPDALGAST